MASTMPRLGAAAMLAAILAGCAVVPAGPYYAHRPCCGYYHPYRW
jgi:hypothetical protein